MRVELANDPERVRLTHALTLDPNRPQMGLKGSAGLFGSHQWWENTLNGRIRVKTVPGVITETLWSGQEPHPGDKANAFVMRCEEGRDLGKSIYINNKRDAALFKPGAGVAFAQALDELKRPSRSETHSVIMLEMAVSKDAG